jgi:hypothetical protein
MNDGIALRLFFRPATQHDFYDKVEYVFYDKTTALKMSDGSIERVPDDVEEIKHNVPKISTGELEIKQSTIPNAGNGTFCARSFEKDEIISYYSGPVVDGWTAKLYDTSHHRSIVTGDKYVIVGNFVENDGINSLIEDPAKSLRNKGIGAYINDIKDTERYNVEFITLDAYENQKIWVEKIMKARQNIQSTDEDDDEKHKENSLLVRDLMHAFDLMIDTKLASNFNIKQRIVIVKALKNIPQGSELFVDYSENYWKSQLKNDKKKKRMRREEEKKKKKNNDNNHKKRKTDMKCVFCDFIVTNDIIDTFTGQLLCSLECQRRYYDKYPNLLELFRSLIDTTS